MSIDDVINEYYKEPEKLTKDNLEEIVGEELQEAMQKLFGNLLLERVQKSLSFSIDAIPNIAVSEIGWSDVRTKDGQDIPGPQRALLINFLKNIPGTDLKDKIQELTNFYQRGTSTVATGATTAEKISKIMSYLVFYKTLTTIITNFNASSAGFNFESFLAVLLDGRHVPTGEGTIADLTAGDGTPISLKLYQEKQVSVDGSFTDLVGDLIKQPGYMQYIVCMKALQGKGLETSGRITWWRFNFTLDNVMNILLNSKHPSILQIPMEFFENPDRSISERVPKRKNITKDELKDVFEKHIVDNIEDESLSQKLIDEISWGSDEADFTQGGKIRVSRFKDVLSNLISDGDVPREQYRPLLGVLGTANMAVVDYIKSTRERASEMLSTFNFLSERESVERYNGLSSSQKAHALASTRGFLYRDQFGLNRSQVQNIEGSENIGSINIGYQYVESMLEEATSLLNASIFDIVTNIQILTTSVNEYFAGGLQDDTRAISAIEASNEIEGKTEELRQTDIVS